MSLLQSLDLSLGVPGLRRPSTLFPWRRAPSPGRVRRAWVIPPISVSENYKRLPYPLVQVRGGARVGRAGVVVSSGSPKVCAFRWECHRAHRLSCPPRRGEGPRLRRGRGPHPGEPPPAHVLPWQIKSDKQQLGSVIYSIQGPGVDEEPRGVFSIDKFTGKVFLNALLDREKMDRFRVGTLGQVTSPARSGVLNWRPGAGIGD